MDEQLKKLYLPAKNSHKGQNGRLLIIGGSHLFHSASLWALKVASRIVDLVHYASVPENNQIVQRLQDEFRDGIVIDRRDLEGYIEEDDCILIGPGMVRSENAKIKMPALPAGRQNAKPQIKNQKLKEILTIQDEGLLTYHLTEYLLNKYPHKKWVIDAGALQMMEPEWIPQGAILTPHHREWENMKLKVQKSPAIAGIPLRREKFKTESKNHSKRDDLIYFSKKYHCTLLLKGETDIVVSGEKMQEIEGGNAGMTKGGTGDVLAGLVAALYCKNDPFTAAAAGSYINKQAGDDLFRKMGYWYNASDLADQIPQTMKRMLGQ